MKKKYNKTDEIKTEEQILALNEEDLKIYYLATSQGHSLKEIVKEINNYDFNTPQYMIEKAERSLNTKLNRWGLKKSKALKCFVNPNFTNGIEIFMDQVDIEANMDDLARMRYPLPPWESLYSLEKNLKNLDMYECLYQELEEVGEELGIGRDMLISKYCLEGLARYRKIDKSSIYEKERLLKESIYNNELATLEVEKGSGSLKEFLLNRFEEIGKKEYILNCLSPKSDYVSIYECLAVYQVIRYKRLKQQEVDFKNLKLNDPAISYEDNIEETDVQTYITAYLVLNELVPEEDKSKEFIFWGEEYVYDELLQRIKETNTKLV